jgi:hypothetical protein
MDECMYVCLRLAMETLTPFSHFDDYLPLSALSSISRSVFFPGPPSQVDHSNSLNYQNNLIMTREEEPPAFNLTEVDRQVLAQTDEEFVLHDWEDLKAIIGMFSRILSNFIFIQGGKRKKRRFPLFPQPLSNNT